jgi:hypothetical protein
MSQVDAFYSVNEAKKSTDHQVHHNNNACEPGKLIPKEDRRPGTGNYRLCKDCSEMK